MFFISPASLSPNSRMPAGLPRGGKPDVQHFLSAQRRRRIRKNDLGAWLSLLEAFLFLLRADAFDTLGFWFTAHKVEEGAQSAYCLKSSV